MERSPLAFVGFALAASSALMAVAWAVGRKLRFLSLVDAVWAYGIAANAAAGFALGRAPFARAAICGGLGVFWGARLGTHLTARLRAHFPREDRRYEALKESWGGSLGWKSFLFFQAQAASMALFAYPFAALALDGSYALRWNELAGATLAAAALLGEAAADAQLRRFVRADRAGHSVCDIGLWRYSRHPNYFFEWVVWCGFALTAAAAPAGAYSLICPAAMLLLLLFVTGVPPAEAGSLRSRGEAYERYRRRTSVFIPWFPRKEGPDAGRKSA
jgi:steroid 5-alpha reductase family enzyme